MVVLAGQLVGAFEVEGHSEPPSSRCLLNVGGRTDKTEIISTRKHLTEARQQFERI